MNESRSIWDEDEKWMNISVINHTSLFTVKRILD